jgi:Zn-finger nucleic acid-binding protein
LLLPYLPGNGLDFRLDHCDHCNGVWLESGEWELLQYHQLASKLPVIFTQAWQQQIRQADHRQRMAAIYTRRFGVPTYAELQRIRAWLQSTPDPSAALAYLTNPDPYGV